MCSILDKTIAQKFTEGAVYSETFAKAFAASGTDLVLDTDYSKQNAKMIVIHAVTINIPTAAVSAHTLIDLFGNTLLNFQATVQMSGYYTCNHLLNAGRLSLRLTGGSTAKMFATCFYQYITYPGLVK